jgi:hypothetical protein
MRIVNRLPPSLTRRVSPSPTDRTVAAPAGPASRRSRAREARRITATNLLQANVVRIPRQVLRVRSLGADLHDRGQIQRIRGAVDHGFYLPSIRKVDSYRLRTHISESWACLATHRVRSLMLYTKSSISSSVRTNGRTHTLGITGGTFSFSQVWAR